MQYKSHKVGGICAGALTTAAIVGIPNTSDGILMTATLVTTAVIGSLCPDIDHPQSKISRRNPILSAMVNLFLVTGKTITNILLLPCFWINKSRKERILKGFEHRGIFHTLIMVLLLTLLIGLIRIPWIIPIQIAFAAGYLSHILMDMLTVSGVRFLYPIINHSFHIPFIRLHTGNMVHEYIARTIFIIVTVILIILFKDSLLGCLGTYI